MNKTKTVSVRMTNSEYEFIKQKAEASGINTSRYIVDRCLQTSILSKNQKQHVYSHICKIKDCAVQKTAKSKIISECDALWQFLK